jgi:SAM-dependent methyltransferase
MLTKINEHNSFYLWEDRRDHPREFFKFLVRVAEPELTPGATVLDVGCATGEFLFYLQSLYPSLVLSGIDICADFIEKAQIAIPNVKLSIGDIYAGSPLPENQFDVVFMSGVNYLFPDWEPWLRNLLSLTKRAAFVFGVFNPEDLDVSAVVRRSGDKTCSTSWNVISEKSISIFLDGLNVRHRFIRWSLPMKNPRAHADPMRSWTIETTDCELLVVNGTQMVQRFAALQIMT